MNNKNINKLPPAISNSELDNQIILSQRKYAKFAKNFLVNIDLIYEDIDPRNEIRKLKKYNSEWSNIDQDTKFINNTLNKISLTNMNELADEMSKLLIKSLRDFTTCTDADLLNLPQANLLNAQGAFIDTKQKLLLSIYKKISGNIDEAFTNVYFELCKKLKIDEEIYEYSLNNPVITKNVIKFMVLYKKDNSKLFKKVIDIVLSKNENIELYITLVQVTNIKDHLEFIKNSIDLKKLSSRLKFMLLDL